MVRILILRFFAVGLLVAAAAGCGSAIAPEPVRAQLSGILAAPRLQPASAAVWDDVLEFYGLHEGKPAWVTDKPTDKVAAAIHVLQSAREHGLNAEDYKATDVSQLKDAVEQLDEDSPSHAQQLAELDVRITASLLRLGRDVALGRQKPNRNGWKARRLGPDLPGTLNRAAREDIGTWLKAVQPVHPEYEALRQALIGLFGQQESGGARVAPTGADAIRVFQEHHAIAPTGVMDAATRKAMAVPLEDRIEQVKVNLERWRWMPDDLGERHLMVNIPYYHLTAREHGKAVKDIRVVVGKPGLETPIFSGEMDTVVFSPYWNIPDSIVEGETAPALAKDPRYLERNNMEILRRSESGETKRVNPSDVDWDDPEELRQLAIRQRPGANNALGHVKFLFPNPYNVYLHDTPADALFERPGRAFSHGCVRVEEPEALAKYVLRDDPSWTEAQIRSAMNAGEERGVKLKTVIPVHIVYFTAGVDEQGGLHFWPDVYGYDRKRR